MLMILCCFGFKYINAFDDAFFFNGWHLLVQKNKISMENFRLPL